MRAVLSLSILSIICFYSKVWALPTSSPSKRESSPTSRKIAATRGNKNSYKPGDYTIFAVERNRGKLAVIRGKKVVAHLGGLGLLHHATLKFRWGRGYLISRDGILSEIDIKKGRIIRQLSVGESSIGLTFTRDKIVVANYRPGGVVVLNKELDIVQKIPTNSRCVGIKSWGRYLIFSLMDRDQIWIMKENSRGEFQEFRKFSERGGMPYDAMLAPPYYLNAYFKKRGFFGLIDIPRTTYRRLPVKTLLGSGITYKIPHFGMWGRWKDLAYLPITGAKGLAAVDLKKLEVVKAVPLSGLPVFVAVSPDGNFIAVNYSGPKQNYLTLLRRRDLQVVTERPVGQRIMHFRFTPDGKYLAISSYFEHRVKILTIPELREYISFTVPTPSGIFIPNTGRK